MRICKKSNRDSGFSIVEIALVLIIFGFVTSLALTALGRYTEHARIARTQNALENSTNIINDFKGNTGFYPCPARLDLAPGEQGYGFEITDATENPGITLTDYAREGRNNLNPLDPSDSGNEQYYFGTIPFNTILNDPSLSLLATDDLSFSGKDSLDGWGSKITYVVSRHLCDAAYAQANNILGNAEGVLDVVTEATCTSEQDGSIVPQSVLPGGCDGDDRRYAQFVLISHGETARGAYNEQGNRGENCFDVIEQVLPGDPNYGANPAGDAWFNGTPSERKNCNYDRPDIGGIRNGEFFIGVRSEGNDSSYYDDYIRFHYEDEFQIWGSATSLTQTLPDGVTTVEISRMKNVNQGNIGIGLNEPEEVLHVNGDMQAFDIEAESFCADINNGICMPSDTLTTTGIVCTDGEVMQSISENEPNCVDPFAGLDFTCALPNERLNTIRSNGSYRCCDQSTGVCNDYP